jgi:PhnB protein
VSQLTINPYINFNGHAREAMEYYHGILGGSLDMQTFSAGEPPKPAGPGDAIMHSRLEADGTILMATDGMEGQAVAMGDNVSLALGGTDHDRLTKVFEGLGEGGKVTMPLRNESWGDTFGMVTDKFGIHWMINITKA